MKHITVIASEQGERSNPAFKNWIATLARHSLGGGWSAYGLLAMTALLLSSCSGYKSPSFSGDASKMSAETLCFRYASNKSPALADEIDARNIDCTTLLRDDPLMSGPDDAAYRMRQIMTLTELTLASLPFAYFLFVSSVTPGPNNLMLAASGMNYGVRRSLPHMFGIAFGFGLMMFLCAIGVGAIYKSWPGFRIILNVFSAIYLLYLSYKIATAESIDVNNKNSKSKPMTFLQAALFQYVNPKAWVMALACVSAFMPAGATMAQQTLIIIVMAIIINLPCTGIWAVFGHGMARLFTTDKSRRIVNAVLAILLVATIPMMML